MTVGSVFWWLIKLFIIYRAYLSTCFSCSICSILFLIDCCNWSVILRPFCWVFISSANSILSKWSFNFRCRVKNCRNAVKTSLRSTLITCLEWALLIERRLIIEIYSLAVIWVDGVIWYCKAASQSFSTNDLPVAATKSFNLFFPP